mgnify:FL=1
MTSETCKRLWSLDEAAKSLAIDSDALFDWLYQRRYAYRYTGVGKKLAYVWWVRRGLFENGPNEMLITGQGLRLLRCEIRRPLSPRTHR